MRCQFGNRTSGQEPFDYKTLALLAKLYNATAFLGYMFCGKNIFYKIL